MRASLALLCAGPGFMIEAERTCCVWVLSGPGDNIFHKSVLYVTSPPGLIHHTHTISSSLICTGRGPQTLAHNQLWQLWAGFMPTDSPRSGHYTYDAHQNPTAWLSWLLGRVTGQLRGQSDDRLTQYPTLVATYGVVESRKARDHLYTGLLSPSAC